MNRGISSKLRNTALTLLILGAGLTGLEAAQPDSDASLSPADCLQALSRPLQEQTGDALPRQLRVLVWNVQKTGNNGWQQDFNRLGMKQDLLLLQEALQGTAGSVTPERSLYAGFAQGYTTDHLTSGVLSLSSARATTQCEFTAMEPWLGTPKAIKVTEYPLLDSGQELLVVNLHAINFTLGISAFREQLMLVRDILVQHEGPAIVAGDFNTWNESRQRFVSQFTGELGLQEVIFDPDLRKRFMDNPLDGFYVRNLRPTDAEVVAVDSSDHNPMLVTLEVF